jgi:nucleotide-binding universal stress UspA family protein
MYKKILVAVDGSTESKAAVQMAKEHLQNSFAEQVTIVNVSPNFENSFEIALARLENMNEIAREFGKKVTEEARAVFSADAKVDCQVIIGDPAMAICDLAEAEGYDLIIMGSRGKNPLSGFLLGSVTTRVLHLAPCPVLVVKEVN